MWPVAGLGRESVSGPGPWGQPVQRDAACWPLQAVASTARPEPVGPLQNLYASPDSGRERARLTCRGAGLCPSSAIASLCSSVPAPSHFSFIFWYHEHFLEQECSRHRKPGTIHRVTVGLPITGGTGRKGCCGAADLPSCPSWGQFCQGKGFSYHTDMPMGAELPAAPLPLVAHCRSIACRAAEQSPAGPPRAAIWAPAVSLIKGYCRRREGGAQYVPAGVGALRLGGVDTGTQDESGDEASSWLERESKGPFIPPPRCTPHPWALSDLLPPANCFSFFLISGAGRGGQHGGREQCKLQRQENGVLKRLLRASSA